MSDPVGDIIQGMDRQQERFKVPRREPASAHAPADAPVAAPTMTDASAKTRRNREKRVSKGSKYTQRGIERGYTLQARLKRQHLEMECKARELAAKEKQLSTQGQQLLIAQQCADAETKRQRREAAATLASGRRSQEWANRLVSMHGEDGEIITPNARAASLQALMDDTYGRNSLEARRAFLAVEAQRFTSISPNSTVRELPVLPVKANVWYISDDGNPVPASVVAVHTGIPPYYTVQFESGRERETIRAKLVPY